MPSTRNREFLKENLLKKVRKFAGGKIFIWGDITYLHYSAKLPTLRDISKTMISLCLSVLLCVPLCKFFFLEE
jgi:hypothetical protein